MSGVGRTPGDEDDVSFLVEDEAPSRVEAAPSTPPPWIVLIVDDDPSVHSITRLVLSDTSFQGRAIQTISAHSSAEALAILRCRHDTALILLDVVMESDDAGLRLVRDVREQIGNRTVRIILRTGEPGQAPERRVILDYDINDYKAKADLTAQSLFTATIAALRGYADIVAVEQNRQGLARLFSGSAWLFTKFDITDFAASALKLVASLFDDAVDAALLLRGREGWTVLVGYGALAEASIERLPTEIAIALATGKPVSTVRMELRPIHCSRHKSAALLIIPNAPVTPVLLDLLDMASSTIGIGLDNAALHEALTAEQAALERRVAERTAELADANTALQASRNLLEEDLRAAGVLQQAILPHAFPPHPRVQGAAIMRPAREIGGDFFDVLAFDADRIVMLVGDVSGKGAQAALFMVLVRALLQEVMAARAGQALLDPATIMAETNHLLIARNPLGLFVTVMFCILDASNGLLRFCSAGHGMPLVRHADRCVERVAGRPSPMLGLIEAASYATHQVQLGGGDAVILNTDGFEEARGEDGSWFGGERLSQAFGEPGCGAPASAILDSSLRAVEQFSGGAPPEDDLTCVVARWMPEL